MQIPQMGFSDHTIHNISLIPESYSSAKKIETDEKPQENYVKSDQEILESTEAIYFTENVDMELHEVKVGQIIVNS